MSHDAPTETILVADPITARRSLARHRYEMEQAITALPESVGQEQRLDLTNAADRLADAVAMLAAAQLLDVLGECLEVAPVRRIEYPID